MKKLTRVVERVTPCCETWDRVTETSYIGMIENLNSANLNVLDRHGIRPCFFYFLLFTLYNELRYLHSWRNHDKSFAIVIVCILYTAVVSRLPTCVIGAVNIIDVHLFGKHENITVWQFDNRERINEETFGVLWNSLLFIQITMPTMRPRINRPRETTPDI